MLGHTRESCIPLTYSSRLTEILDRTRKYLIPATYSLQETESSLSGSLVDKPSIHQATLKKKFVSCPAGGHNNGQSGGRNIFFF